MMLTSSKQLKPAVTRLQKIFDVLLNIISLYFNACVLVSFEGIKSLSLNKVVFSEMWFLM